MRLEPSSQQPVAAPAGAAKELVHVVEEQGMVNWEGKGDVSEVSRTSDGAQSACAALLLLVSGPKGRVVQAPCGGVQQSIKGLWVCDLSTAHFLHLACGIRLKGDCRHPVLGLRTHVFLEGGHFTWHWIGGVTTSFEYP